MSTNDKAGPARRSARAEGRTAELIIEAAERLFAERGIDGVSLREINRAAGQNNTAAVQYYFGDRGGLVQAILARHREDDEHRRHALLDEYEHRAEPDLWSLAGALVEPLAAKLHDPDGGRAYLQIAAEHYSRPGTAEELIAHPPANSSMMRWHRLVDELVRAEERTVLHSRFPALRFALVELARRAAAPPRRDDTLFVSHLTDLVSAVLAAEPSDRTLGLLARRKRNASPAPT